MFSICHSDCLDLELDLEIIKKKGPIFFLSGECLTRSVFFWNFHFESIRGGIQGEKFNGLKVGLAREGGRGLPPPDDRLPARGYGGAAGGGRGPPGGRGDAF